MSKVIGIISYFPDKQPDRDQRINRFNSLLTTLDGLWPDIPILVVAQNWKDYSPKKSLIVHSYGKLGILGARRKLREIFLSSPYENMITMDDDVIISGSSGLEYMRQVDAHPDGMGVFCWEHSQLNLLYMSKYIYSKMNIPDIDPEKDEGFEDVVFTSQCKKEFPDRVFTFKDTGLTESSFRYTGEGKVPSTWAGGGHDWKKLRENTRKIKEKIEGTVKNVKEDNNKIDIVVTYVDSSDPSWMEIFNKHVIKNGTEESIGKQRFRRNDNFRYWFRGLEKYTPWINNVFLVVSSRSQVPSWVDTTKVIVVLHEEFIPNEYLPVFNSQAIEMFLHRIPGLSEKFLYANDDVYFMGDLKPDNFFIGGKLKNTFNVLGYGEESTMPLWKRSIINSGLLVNKKETEELKSKGNYISPMHSTRPYLKSKMEEAFTLHRESILASISKFREPKNLTIYLYDFYLRACGLVIEKDYVFNQYSSKTPLGFIRNSLINPEINKVMCLNDTSEDIDNVREYEIEKVFKLKFPDKSKYENKK